MKSVRILLSFFLLAGLASSLPGADIATPPSPLRLVSPEITNDPANQPPALGDVEKFAAPATPVSPFTADQQSMAAENNRIRAAGRKGPQTLDPQLCRAAQQFAEHMRRTGNFSHYADGSPGNRIARTGLPVSTWRENIASSGSISGAFVMWQNSGGHYRNIMSNCTHVGFGRAGNYLVGLYATPSSPPDRPRRAGEFTNATYATELPPAASETSPTTTSGPENFQGCSGGSCRGRTIQRRGLLGRR